MPGYKKEYVRFLVSLSTLGIEMGVSVAVGFFIGKYLDKLFNTGKTLTLIFILFGIAAGFKSLFIAAKKGKKELQKHKLYDVYKKNNKGDEHKRV